MKFKPVRHLSSRKAKPIVVFNPEAQQLLEKSCNMGEEMQPRLMRDRDRFDYDNELCWKKACTGHCLFHEKKLKAMVETEPVPSVSYPP